jgi:NTP pyrophosphatase (non-canonical NTP hydrolase)
MTSILHHSAPVPFTLTAKARAFLDRTSPGRHEGTAIIDGPDGWACGRCGFAWFGPVPEDGQCPGCQNLPGAACPPAITAPPDLREIARHLAAVLTANRRQAITDASQLDVQALCVAEEAGELVGAYRRWAGKARRTGTRRALEDEIADVLIVTAVFAERAGIDLNEAIARKLTVIYSRGWREEDGAA